MAKVKLYDELGNLLGFCDLSNDGSVIASASVLGNVKIGQNINVTNAGVISVPNANELEAGVVKSFAVAGTYDGESTKVTFTPTENIANVSALKALINNGAIVKLNLGDGGVGYLCINDSSTEAEQVVTFVGVIGGSVVAAEVIDAAE